MKLSAKMNTGMLKAFLSHYLELHVAQVILTQILPVSNPLFPFNVTLIALRDEDAIRLEKAFTQGSEFMRDWRQYFER